jgi:hypothetical protein
LKNWRKFPKVRKNFTQNKKIPKNSQVVLLKKKNNCSPSQKKTHMLYKIEVFMRPIFIFLKMVVVIVLTKKLGLFGFLCNNSDHLKTNWDPKISQIFYITKK